jgi:hypothetical protein
MPAGEMTELWAWVAIDAVDGSEGIAAYRMPETGCWMPLIGTQLDRVAPLELYARMVERETGTTCVLKRFVLARWQ